MGRSQRHKIEIQGYDSSGDRYEQGAVGGSVKAPTLSSLSPNTAVHGAADATVTATGTNFATPMYVSWAGTILPAVVVSATSLTFVAPISQQGFAVIKVVKVLAGPYESGTVNFTLT